MHKGIIPRINNYAKITFFYTTKQFYHKKLHKRTNTRNKSGNNLKFSAKINIFARYNPRHMTRKKKIGWGIFIAAAAVLTATAILLGYPYYKVKIKKVKLNETAYLYITPDDNSASIMEKLEKLTGGQSTEGFSILAQHNNFDSRKRSGKFAIKNGDSMHDIYRRIVSNEQTPVRVTVPSTRTVELMAGTVSKQIMADSASLASLLKNDTYMSCFGYTPETAISLIIPDTYEVYWNIDAEQFIQKLAEERRKFWNENRKAKAKEIGLTAEEVATLASIVDEETANTSEMPTVAGLYINRLKKGMMLQADPTVKYALGDPTRRRILNKDLEVNSPYNTYKHTGLPPGPIRIPTKQALESVLNYKKHDYLYMCAKEDFSGTHNFAKTLSEHNSNAQRYQQALNRLNIKK